jgi:hypothetical protein
MMKIHTEPPSSCQVCIDACSQAKIRTQRHKQRIKQRDKSREDGSLSSTFAKAIISPPSCLPPHRRKLLSAEELKKKKDESLLWKDEPLLTIEKVESVMKSNVYYGRDWDWDWDWEDKDNKSWPRLLVSRNTSLLNHRLLFDEDPSTSEKDEPRRKTRHCRTCLEEDLSDFLDELSGPAELCPER